MKKILILLTVMIGIISCESRSLNRIGIGCSDDTINLPKGEVFENMIISARRYIITKDTLGNYKIYLIGSGYLEERHYIINN